MNYLYIVRGGGPLSSDPAAELLLLIYDLNAKEWWRSYCLKAVCNTKWNRWREGLGNKNKNTGAFGGLGREQGFPVIGQSPCTQSEPYRPLPDPHRFLPGVGGCHACAVPDCKAVTGPFQDAFLQEWEPSSNIFLLKLRVLFLLRAIASVAALSYVSPSGDFPPAWWFPLAGTEQQVAITIPVLVFAAGGLFKKLSDSFGSNNSFQGDLEERKCDINLT